MATYRPRRSAKDWQTLIQQQARSELSVKEFCTEHDLGYSSFQNWKSKLGALASTHNSDDIAAAYPPAFIELTNPGVQRDKAEAALVQASPTWLAELDLGSGICLRIARPA